MADRGDSFPSAFAALDTRQQLAFLSELWAVRGYRTTIEDDRVVAHRAGRTVRIGCGGAERPDRTTLDILLTTADSTEAAAGPTGESGPGTVVEPDALIPIIKYGIPRPAADRLCRRYLDRSVEGLRADPQNESTGNPTAIPRRSVGLGLGVLTFGAVWVGSLGLAGSAESTDGPLAIRRIINSVFGLHDDAPPDPAPSPGRDAHSALVDQSSLPPGIEPDGSVAQADHIAGHLGTASDSPLGGSVTIVGQPVPKRFDGDVYLSPAGEGNWVWGLYWLAFADGDVRVTVFVSADDEIQRARLDEDARTAGHVDRRAVPPPARSTVASGTAVTRIRADANPDPIHFDIDTMRLRSFVAESGEILHFTLEFRYPWADRPVLVRFDGDGATGTADPQG